MAMNTNLNSTDTLEFAIFFINEMQVAMPLNYLERFNIIGDITKLPRAPDFISGFIRIESGIVPLIDLGVYINKEAKIETENAVALIVTVDDSTFALRSKSVPIVYRAEKVDKKGKSPESLPKNWIVGYIEVENGLVPVLDPKEFWSNLGPSAAVTTITPKNEEAVGDPEDELEKESETSSETIEEKSSDMETESTNEE